MQKEIYSFTVNKKVKVEVVEELPDGSKLTKTEEQVKPILISIKSPSRTEVGDSEFEYAKEYGRLFRAGIMTREMVKKAYDATSFLADKKVEALALVGRLKDVQTRYQELLASREAGNKDESLNVEEESLQKEWAEFNSGLQNIELSVEGVFSNTAEVLAERHVVSYLTLLLTIGEDGRNVFKGDSHEARLKNYDALLAIDSTYYGEIGEKAAYAVGLYYSGKAADKQEFDSFFGIAPKAEEVVGETVESKEPEKAKESV